METKLCNKCKLLKPLVAFQKNRSTCRDCRNARAVELYHENPAHFRQKALKSYHSNKHNHTEQQIEHFKKYQKEYSKIRNQKIETKFIHREYYWKNRDNILRKQREEYKLTKPPYKKREPYREKCKRKFHYAIKIGRIIKQPCVICGKFPADGHHSDYSKPLDIVWLCRQHHVQLHCNYFCLI